MTAFDLPWTTVITDNTGGTDGFHPSTPWRRIDPKTTNIRGWMEVVGIQGAGMRVRPGVQVTNDLASPGTDNTGAIATEVQSDGVTDPDSTQQTVTLLDAKYIRAGWMVRCSSGTGSCRVSGRIELTD